MNLGTDDAADLAERLARGDTSGLQRRRPFRRGTDSGAERACQKGHRDPATRAILDHKVGSGLIARLTPLRHAVVRRIIDL
jgi:hypothetical protein